MSEQLRKDAPLPHQDHGKQTTELKDRPCYSIAPIVTDGGQNNLTFDAVSIAGVELNRRVKILIAKRFIYPTNDTLSWHRIR
jgi:hypothetical protein